MRVALIAVTVAAVVSSLCAGAALADTEFTYTYNAVRDNSNNTNEQHNNIGGSIHGYSGNYGTGYQFYVDWDTAAMKAQTQDIACPISYELWLHFEGNGGWGHWPCTVTSTYVATFWSENDWTEGNGGSWDADYNWGTATAATHLYAQDVTPDSSGAIDWIYPGDGGANPRDPGCTFVETYYKNASVITVANSAYYEMGCGADQVRYDYHGIALDQAVIDDLYDNENNRGLVVYNFDAYGSIFTRNVPPNTPYIKAIFTAHDGDANLDGCVDGLDYVAWSNNYDQSNMQWEDGDYNADGTADGLDYVVWSNNYNVGCPGSPAAVPEPTILMLLSAALPLMLRRRGASRPAAGH